MFTRKNVLVSLVSGDALNRAYEMIYFVHKDSGIAQVILSAAVESFDPQIRIRSDRDLKFAGREENLFQGVALNKSEQVSRKRQEMALNGAEVQKANGLLSNAQMYINYVQNIASEEFRSSSFYVNLSVSCLLHNYTCKEAVQIYDELQRDSDSYDYNKGYDYHNKQLQTRKKRLKERFGAYENALKERNLSLEAMSVEDETRLKRFLDKLLDFFAPWGTDCKIGFTSDNVSVRKEKLSETERELNIHHSLYHKKCYSEITSALGLDKPGKKVRFPISLFAKEETQEDDDFDDRLDPPLLNEEVLRLLETSVVNRRKRAKAFKGTVLKVLIDGEPKGYLHTDRTSPLKLEFDWGSRLIELFGKDEAGEFVVASLSVPADLNLYADGPLVFRSKEAGHRIEFVVNPVIGDGESEAQATLEISYRNSLMKALAHRFSRWRTTKPIPVSKNLEVKVEISSTRRTAAVWNAAAVIICLVIALYAVWLKSKSSPPEVATEHQPGVEGDDQNANKNAQAPEQTLAENNNQPPLNAKDHGARNTQNGNAKRATEETSHISNKAFRLDEVKTVYIDIEAKGAQLDVREQEAIQFGLDSVISRRYSIQDSPSGSDARLRIEVLVEGGGMKAVARLVNIEGEDLAKAATSKTKRESGEPALNQMRQLGRDVGEKLLQDIERKLSQKK